MTNKTTKLIEQKKHEIEATLRLEVLCSKCDNAVDSRKFTEDVATVMELIAQFAREEEREAFAKGVRQKTIEIRERLDAQIEKFQKTPPKQKKTAEEVLTKEQIETFIEVIMANMKLELRKDSLVIVWQDGLKKYAGGLKLPKKTMSLIEAAKAERDEYWKEKIKEVTALRMACACLKPNCEKDGWNSAMESVERNLLSPNKEENGQRE